MLSYGEPMNEQRKENGAGMERLRRAVRCSRAGLSAAWRNEEAFRQELLLGLVLVPLALWLGESGGERALLIGSLFVLFIVELLNTAIEVVVDRIGLERHDLSGLAKDLGSSAVSLAITQAVLVWLLVLFT